MLHIPIYLLDQNLPSTDVKNHFFIMRIKYYFRRNKKRITKFIFTKRKLRNFSCYLMKNVTKLFALIYLFDGAFTHRIDYNFRTP